MMLTKADARKYVAQIDKRPTQKLLQIRHILMDITSMDKMDIDACWLLEQVNGELTKRGVIK